MISRAELRDFGEAADIIKGFLDAGWSGRISTNGHAILRAPDGVTTVSVSKAKGDHRALTQAKSDLRRWLKRSIN